LIELKPFKPLVCNDLENETIFLVFKIVGFILTAWWRRSFCLVIAPFHRPCSSPLITIIIWKFKCI